MNKKAKTQIMAIAAHMPVDPNWSGVLNEANINNVAARIRLMFEGKAFAIASAQYVDSAAPELNLDTGVRFNSERTDRAKIPVRVFEKQKGMCAYLSWSAGGYLWSYHPALGRADEHHDYRYTHFRFHEGSMTITYRAPAGRGCLHKYVYKV